mmetsp:Transcript_1843/g.5856  ORF Transcript_1843/g.5856 Transcript_1843/m.5856 type:complete len:201 (+) Transcript_1843:933-1535(+)
MRAKILVFDSETTIGQIMFIEAHERGAVHWGKSLRLMLRSLVIIVVVVIHRRSCNRCVRLRLPRRGLFFVFFFVVVVPVVVVRITVVSSVVTECQSVFVPGVVFWFRIQIDVFSLESSQKLVVVFIVLIHRFFLRVGGFLHLLLGIIDDTAVPSSFLRGRRKPTIITTTTLQFWNAADTSSSSSSCFIRAASAQHQTPLT